MILKEIEIDQMLLQISVIKARLKMCFDSLVPKDQELMDEIEYLVNNNLPIKKEKLYRFIPDMFMLEIEDLDPIE